MIALDTNILVYAHREDSPLHAPARAALGELAGRSTSFAVPWPCVSEFLAVVTHPRIYAPPSPITDAIAAINALAALPNARFLGEASNHLSVLASLAGPGIVGARLHDARIAAICLSHGITELWTADRDFSYFPQLRTRNPLV